MHPGKCPAPWEMSILSNVRRCWLAMPLVAGFLEMFACVTYKRENKKGLRQIAKLQDLCGVDYCDYCYGGKVKSHPTS